MKTSLSRLVLFRLFEGGLETTDFILQLSVLLAQLFNGSVGALKSFVHRTQLQSSSGSLAGQLLLELVASLSTDVHLRKHRLNLRSEIFEFETDGCKATRYIPVVLPCVIASVVVSLLFVRYSFSVDMIQHLFRCAPLRGEHLRF